MRRSRSSGKYGAVRTQVDGITFASAMEARRYSELRLLEMSGEIADLEIQPRYPIRVNGELICTYVADFRYREGGRLVVEDVKSPATRTRLFIMKKRLMKAVNGVDVIETSA